MVRRAFGHGLGEGGASGIGTRGGVGNGRYAAGNNVLRTKMEGNP